MNDTLLQGRPTQLWQDLVAEGQARAATPLDEDVQAYLVFALMRHLSDAGLLRRTMALELLDALEASGRRRVDELRDVGDRCLLIAGLFPRLADRRRVGRRYFADLGRGAYANAAGAARFSYAELFGRLAGAFDGMVTVLAHAAASCTHDVRPLARTGGASADLAILLSAQDNPQLH